MPNPSLVAFPGRLTITDATGARCPGAKLHIAGKVEGSRGDAREAMALYADAARTIPLPNPVVADADGMLPTIYLSGTALNGAAVASSPFDCVATTATNKILWSYSDCRGFPIAMAAAAYGAPGILFDPTRLDWGPDVHWRRAPYHPEDTASAELLKRLGISTDTPPDAGDNSHRES
jgi:hypothetical protein